MPATIHLYRHTRAAWREVVRPWLAQGGSLRRSHVVVPTRGQAHAFKQQCIESNIPLLGVELLTPGLARRKWAEHIGESAQICAGSGGLQAAGRGATRLAFERHLDAQRQEGRDFVASGGLETAPPCALDNKKQNLTPFHEKLHPPLGREFLLLGLRSIIERRLKADDSGILKSLRSDCDKALDDFDDLLKAGFSAADFPEPLARDVFVELDAWVTGLDRDFAPRQTRDFVRSGARPLIAGRALIHGFSAEQRNEFFNVAAFARCFEDVTLTIPEPEFLRPKGSLAPEVDEAWMQLWEKTLGVEADRIEDTDPPESCENVAEIWASSNPGDIEYGFEPPEEHRTDLLVGVSRADEMELVARKIDALLASGAENIGVIFPVSDASHLRLADLLARRGVAFSDQLETVSAPPDFIQAQCALLAFYERGCRLEELGALWPFLSLFGQTELPLPAARAVLEQLYDRCQSHSLPACLKTLGENKDGRVDWEKTSKVAAALLGREGELAWPDKIVFSNALDLFSSACARLGFGELPMQKALQDFAALETRPLPAAVVCETFRAFLSERKQSPAAPGRGNFARVTLTTRRRAEGVLWSHAIFVEANAGVWPQRQESSCWLTDRARAALNRRAHDGPDLTGADERAFLEKRGFALLARDTRGAIVFSGALFNEEEPELRLGPNSWVERVRWHFLTRDAAARGGAPKTEEIFEKLAQSSADTPVCANPLSPQKHGTDRSVCATLENWHAAWLSRRDPEKPFDDFFFSVDPAKKRVASLAAREIEAGFKDPARLWFDEILRLERAEWRAFARNRKKSLGILAHELLAAAFRGDAAKKEFRAMPTEAGARARLEQDLAALREAWPRDCYWESFHAELSHVCAIMLGKVFALRGDYVATEYRLPDGVLLPAGKPDSDARIAVRGRMDLLRLSRQGFEGADVQIVDFKTGGDNARISAASMGAKGASLQLGVYLAAAQSLGATSGRVWMFKPAQAAPACVDMAELWEGGALAGLERIHRHIARGCYGALTADRSEYTFGATGWPIACAPIPHAILKEKFERTFGIDAGDTEGEGGDE